MKIRTLALGEYGSPPVRFCLYLFPTPLTPPLCSPSQISSSSSDDSAMQEHHSIQNRSVISSKDADCCFLCLDDLDALFFKDTRHHDDAKQALSKAYFEHPSWFCADQASGRPFVTTRAVAHIAGQLQLETLVDLCSMSESDICHGHAEPLVRRIEGLRRTSVLALDQELVPTRLLDGAARFRVHSNITAAACSPMIRLSPPSDHASTAATTTRFDPCRDDVASSGSGSCRRLSFVAYKDATSSNQQQQQQQPLLPKPSSLLLKRSAHHQHNKAPSNLTIMTPAYGADDPASIHSAPLHPRAHKQNPVSALPSAKHRVCKVLKRAPPATAAPWSKHHKTGAAATAGAVAAATAATAGSLSAARPQTEFPSPPIVPSQQRYPAPPATAALKTATFLPKTPAALPTQQQPQPATAALSRKQQFLQPFEMLYDNIEQTRSLKATLDDQIRHSSTLIHSLQSSSTMVETLTRKYVRESVHQQLQEYVGRIEWLEQRMLQQRTSSRSPPPQQRDGVKHLLSDLVHRLDRLESKMDTKQ